MEKKVIDDYIAQNRRAILKFILAKVKSYPLAEDLTQDVFIKFVEQVRNQNIIHNLDGYLFTIAKNKIYDYWRDVSRNEEMIEVYWREIRCNQIIRNYPHINMDRKVIFSLLESRLTEQQRKIFLLNRQNGLSYSEIADQLQLSKSTVKNHMVSALKIIRGFMDKHADKLIGLACIGWVI